MGSGAITLVCGMVVLKAGTYLVLHVNHCSRMPKTVYLWEGATTPKCPDCEVTFTFVGEEDDAP
jgi:hypothetical protein